MLTRVRRLTAFVFRALPWLPAHRSLRRHLNTFFLEQGASPIEVAPLQLGLRASVDLRTRTQRDVLYVGQYDERLLACCARLILQGGTVLDVGANIGLATLPLAKTARTLGGVVHAFEPLPTNVERLRSNIELNALGSVVTVWPLGLSSADGTATISLREDFGSGGTTGNAAIVIDDSDNQFELQTIELRAFDQLLPQLKVDRVDFVKLDIEGHEDFFLEGAQQALAKYRPVIMMEINKPYYERRKVSLDVMLRRLLPGYRMLASEGGKYRWWRLVASVDDCRRLDNVFMAPEERVDWVMTKLNLA